MIEAPVHLAKSQLTRLLKQVEAGERVVITRHGRPVAELVRVVGEKRFSLDRVVEIHKAQGLPTEPVPVPGDFDEIDLFGDRWTEGPVFPDGE